MARAVLAGDGGDAIRAVLPLPGAERGAHSPAWWRAAGSAHPLRPDDPFALLAPADALLARGGLRLLRPRESVEANAARHRV